MKTDQVIYKKTVQFIDEEHIAIKPLCDFFGINYKHQAHKFKNDSVLNQLSRKNKTVAYDLREREMISVRKNGFLIWVSGISDKMVDPNMREKFIDFKLHIHDYFEKLQGDAAYHRLKYFELKELLREDEGIRFTRSSLVLKRKNIFKRMDDIINDQLDLELGEIAEDLRLRGDDAQEED